LVDNPDDDWSAPRSDCTAISERGRQLAVAHMTKRKLPDDARPLLQMLRRVVDHQETAVGKTSVTIVLLMEYFNLPLEPQSLGIVLWRAIESGLVKLPDTEKGRPRGSFVPNDKAVSAAAIRKRRQRSGRKHSMLRLQQLEKQAQRNAQLASQFDRITPMLAELLEQVERSKGA
jgi:hypothetical protein